MATIILYTLTSDRKCAKKSITQIRQVNCNLKMPTDIINPTFILTKADYSRTNYIYWVEEQRYYFVNNPTYIEGGLVEIPCHVDVLSSWWKHLSNIQTLVERQENVWSPYIIDTELPTRTERNISYKVVGNIGSPTDAYIALTVSGGEGGKK